MPLELGIDLGARYFGADHVQKKRCLILDSAPYRYQKFISDIAGQDPTSHDGDPERAIRRVSDWLRTDSRKTNIPDGNNIVKRCRLFLEELPQLCEEKNLEVDELPFVEYTQIVFGWLRRNPLQKSKKRGPKPKRES
jgi:hypothetical protein